jgi:23S rRNA (pseudouridine1915-N3)-methyltransferase
MKVRVASIGRDRSGLFAPAVEEYAGRLTHYCKLELVELPAARSRDDEAKALLALARDKDWIIALDERGEQLSSTELSQQLARAQNASRDLLFLVGGDEGHAKAALERARLTLSLSRMTLPHRLARLVLVEQLYRAFTLLRGEPYHK